MCYYKAFRKNELMSDPKVAIITGITGQDGAYLANLLLDKVISYMELIEELLLQIFGD